MRKWLQKILGIEALIREVESVRKLIGDRTTVHCDIHTKEPSQVIVIGRYRNKDYVRCFNVSSGDLPTLIEELKHAEPYSRVGRFDTIGGVPFSVVYEKEVF